MTARRQDQARPADEARQAAVPQLELVEQPRLRRRHHDVGEHLKYHGHAGRADQPRRGRPQSVEGPVHISVLPEVPQQGGNNQDHDDGGRHLSQCGDHRAGDTGNGEAHIGGHVDADGAGGGLGHRQHVHELGLGEPAGGLPDVVEEGQRGHTAADGKESGLEKLPEQAQIDHAPFTSQFFSRIPSTAAARMNHTGDTSITALPTSTARKIAAVGLSTTDFFSSFTVALKIRTHTHT